MQKNEIDPIDAQLLDILQKDFPIVSRPFDAIARTLCITPGEVISRINSLKASNIIRQISAIFDSQAIGYNSALAAFKVCDSRIDQVARDISRHSGVSHCYSRDADYNLWFTITLGPGEDLSKEVESLVRAAAIDDYMFLPAVRVFKIGVFFGISLESDNPAVRSSSQPKGKHLPLSHSQIAAVRALQRDIPIVDRPFASLASLQNLTEQELLERAHYFLEAGMMRRFAAVLRHRRVGYSANAMVCWRVDEQDIERVGRLMAENSAVSHCYQRPISDQWPYALYTMIHARSDELIAKVISELSASTGINDPAVLRTINEYKKSRVVYFD